MKYKRKLYTTIKRRLIKQRRYIIRTLRKPRYAATLLMIGGLAALIVVPMQPTPRIYTDHLLATIASVESKNNYNAYFGNATNTSVHFTDMSVSDVLAWQKQFVAQGSPSSAVGRYQFVDSTLAGLVRQLHIDPSVKFDPVLQDRLAVALLERRGIREYADNKISRETFAHNLSKEWAALPRVIGDNPDQSYYASDGLNKAQLSVEQIYSSIATVRKL